MKVGEPRQIVPGTAELGRGLTHLRRHGQRVLEQPGIDASVLDGLFPLFLREKDGALEAASRAVGSGHEHDDERHGREGSFHRLDPPERAVIRSPSLLAYPRTIDGFEPRVTLDRATLFLYLFLQVFDGSRGTPHALRTLRCL